DVLKRQVRNEVQFTAPAEGLYLEHVYLSEATLLEDFGTDITIHRKKSLQND
ncbi:tRNA pseudouridine(38-40) synthase TruA, partial [Staphylococcus arlettae]